MIDALCHATALAPVAKSAQQPGLLRTNFHTFAESALIAAREKNTPLVKLLLSQGANINAKNKDGHTLLHYALQNKDKNLRIFLIESGATLDVEDSAL